MTKLYYTLNEAIEKEDLELFDQILADVDKKDLEMTIDICADSICGDDHVKVVDFLIDSVYSPYVDYEFLFCEAVRRVSVRIVEYLIDIGKCPALDNRYVIKNAILSKSITMLKLCANYGWIVYADLLKMEPSCFNEEFEIAKIKILLELGIDINYNWKVIVSTIPLVKVKRTYLHLAIIKDSIKLVKLLLQNGANVDYTHLSHAVEDFEIFCLIYNQNDWTDDELKIVLKKCFDYDSDKTISTAKFLLKNCTFDGNLLLELINANICTELKNMVSKYLE